MYYQVFWTGNIESAGKAHMVSKMKQGQSFGLMPGGFHELNLFETNKERVYVKKQGFIKYALQYGYVTTPWKIAYKMEWRSVRREDEHARYMCMLDMAV